VSAQDDPLETGIVEKTQTSATAAGVVMIQSGMCRHQPNRRVAPQQRRAALRERVRAGRRTGYGCKL